MRKFSDICESVWMDIHKQSNGDSFKKEDQGVIDLMNEFIQRHNLKEGEYKINGNLTLDVYQSLRITEDDLVDGLLPFQFGEVDGDFDVSHLDLNSFENSPREVAGLYNAVYNIVKDLTGCPQTVGENFNVGFNANLRTLDGSPDKVGGDYKIYGAITHLSDIKGISKEIQGNLIIEKRCRFSDEDFRRYSNIQGDILRK